MVELVVSASYFSYSIVLDGIAYEKQRLQIYLHINKFREKKICSLEL